MAHNTDGREPTNAELEQRFAKWWNDEGSGIAPRDGEECCFHAERVSRIAWMNGAFVASCTRPMPDEVAVVKESLTTQLGAECEHGHLARKCETCALIEREAECERLRESAQFWKDGWHNLDKDNARLSSRVAELEKWKTDAITWVECHRSIPKEELDEIAGKLGYEEARGFFRTYQGSANDGAKLFAMGVHRGYVLGHNACDAAKMPTHTAPGGEGGGE